MALQFFVDNMRAYAPRMILDIAATDPGSLLRPSSRAVPAAVLFADVVGFSGLVEEMTRADPDKVAHIASILDGYVERLVDLLLDHGGDIAKFAGDAVFAVWPANGDLAGALTRAARCAEEIQAELHELEQLPGVALSLRVVLASGELHVATIGGVYGHWEIVVAGEPIRQISRLGGLAEPGTVLLSPEAIEALDAAGRLEHVDGKARVLPVVLPPVPPHEVRLTQEGLEALLSFLPSAVATRPEIGTADDAELRPITTMFVVVRGFRYPGEATVDDAQRVLEAIQECIYDHDGALNRFGVDDKGAVALAAWGLPPDDPVEQHLLPVRAALAIRG
ncbi:MAG: hypothetical protein KDA24_28345, partial [Deltaproteobacteria bacterium]|nr:hypothetical protein [Deltaproteobacteria bacterium]